MSSLAVESCNLIDFNVTALAIKSICVSQPRGKTAWTMSWKFAGSVNSAHSSDVRGGVFICKVNLKKNKFR